MKAISPLDGRYRREVDFLRHYFSESALVEARVWVELMWLDRLSQEGVVRPLTEAELRLISEIQRDQRQFARVKRIERKINHDTKAVEIYLRRKVAGTSLADLTEFIHFGLTSTDVDNLALGTLFKQALREEITPTIFGLLARLSQMAKEDQDYPMLGRTHGQPAVPTTLGKELDVFVQRLRRELEKLLKLEVPGKLTGAVGNFSALRAAYPRVNWEEVSTRFVTSLGLNPKLVTTQIPPYEDLCEIFDCLRRINSIVIDLDRDLCDYLSRGYFILTAKPGEVGSSTMPQKVNPIDFERSEAHLKVSNALLELLSRELPLNRLQRDLTDKSLLRFVGEAVGEGYLSWKWTKKGLVKIKPDLQTLQADLLNHWECLAEGIQTILRKHGHRDAYEEIAARFKGRTLDSLQYRWILEELKPKVSQEAWAEISKLHPLEVR